MLGRFTKRASYMRQAKLHTLLEVFMIAANDAADRGLALMITTQYFNALVKVSRANKRLDDSEVVMEEENWDPEVVDANWCAHATLLHFSLSLLYRPPLAVPKRRASCKGGPTSFQCPLRGPRRKNHKESQAAARKEAVRAWRTEEVQAVLLALQAFGSIPTNRDSTIAQLLGPARGKLQPGFIGKIVKTGSMMALSQLELKLKITVGSTLQQVNLAATAATATPPSVDANFVKLLQAVRDGLLLELRYEVEGLQGSLAKSNRALSMSREENSAKTTMRKGVQDARVKMKKFMATYDILMFESFMCLPPKMDRQDLSVDDWYDARFPWAEMRAAPLRDGDESDDDGQENFAEESGATGPQAAKRMRQIGHAPCPFPSRLFVWPFLERSCTSGETASTTASVLHGRRRSRSFGLGIWSVPSGNISVALQRSEPQSLG